jgi:FkbM family methyltransferase
MSKLIKRIIKYLLYKTSWRLKKIYKNKGYVHEKPNLDSVLSLYNSKGIIHMGAHRGGEATVYDWFQKKTLWIEANPLIIKDLQDHVNQFPNQKVIQALLSDKDGEKLDFKISNNDSASSSIFDFGQESIQKNLRMISNLKIKSQTLDMIVEREKIEISEYDYWILDLQGAELLTLQGAKKSLKNCKFILVEISKSEYYVNGAKWENLKNFLNTNNFFEKWEPKENHTDVLFVKTD